MRFRTLPRDELVAAAELPAPLSPITAEAARELAVALGHTGVGRVSPNPLVGAVIVDREHRFVAAGAHRKVGGAHAEVDAFAAAAAIHGARGASGEAFRGGSIYVTLEPCAHQGRTPACAPRVAASGLARCVFGAYDPNPQVAGKGASTIAAAGLAVVHDAAWEPECTRLAEVFLHDMTAGRPFVGLKAAASLDGMLARDGDARVWITGSRARRYGHFLRVVYDAIAVGRRTMAADDPILDARDSLVPGRAPRRLVLDPRGTGLTALHQQKRLPRLAQHQPDGVGWLVGATAAASSDLAAARSWIESAGVEVVPAAADPRGRLDVAALLRVLRAKGVQSLLLEGGAGLYGTFLDAGLVDRVHLFQAPVFMGAARALPFAAAAGELATRLRDVEITALGDDWLIEGRC